MCSVRELPGKKRRKLLSDPAIPLTSLIHLEQEDSVPVLQTVQPIAPLVVDDAFDLIRRAPARHDAPRQPEPSPQPSLYGPPAARRLEVLALAVAIDCESVVNRGLRAAAVLRSHES